MLLRHIRHFIAVAEHGNFTRAADVLHVSQPTLSQQIRQLEDTLGALLFDRSGRRARLTDTGEAWLRYARLALRDLGSGARDSRRGSAVARVFAFRCDADVYVVSDCRCVQGRPRLPARATAAHASSILS